MNGGWGVGLSFVLDVQGVNYGYGEYDTYHKSHPQQPIIGSETASCTCARNIYVGDDKACHKDVYSADGCATNWWTSAETRDWVAGGFAWTGFDYKGEPSPYGWPDVNSNYGIIDIAGYPKDTFYYYQSWWTNKTVLHLFPHWNWAGSEGKNINVWAYSNAAAVEVSLNGRSFGKKNTPKLGHSEWLIPYQAGTLTATAYNAAGSTIATQTTQTSGSAASVSLNFDAGSSSISADGQDVSLVTASILDSNGRLVPTATNLVSFGVQGPGTILGVGNGDPGCIEPDKGASRSAFGGLVRILVQSMRNQPGTITLTASANGIAGAKLSISSK